MVHPAGLQYLVPLVGIRQERRPCTRYPRDTRIFVGLDGFPVIVPDPLLWPGRVEYSPFCLPVRCRQGILTGCRLPDCAGTAVTASKRVKDPEGLLAVAPFVT